MSKIKKLFNWNYLFILLFVITLIKIKGLEADLLRKESFLDAGMDENYREIKKLQEEVGYLNCDCD